MPLQAREAPQSQFTNAEEANDSLAVELEAKQAELRGKQAQLDSAAEEATRLQGQFEEQARLLTQRSEQAESLQKDLNEAADAQEDLSKVSVLPHVILCNADAN